MYLWGCLFFFLGFSSCIVGTASQSPGSGAMKFAGGFWIVGLVLYLRARFGAWWNHG